MVPLCGKMDKLDRQERLERTASIAYNKGLINNPGENNCFLNSAVQVLWHLDVFRRSFREIKGHYCMGQSCIFCALDLIFRQFQYSSNDALPPDGLRVALAVAFKDQHRFQLGDMDDAAECFENILSHMHMLVARNEHDDACTAKHCISHQKFAMQIIEQTICHCGELSEPLPFFQLVHYVSASALCAKAKSLKGWDNSRPIESQFGVLLRRAGQDTRECQSPDCKDRVQVQRLLLNCPDIVSVGLIWDSESPDAQHIADVLQCIGTTLKLSDLYHQVYDERAKDSCLQLVGIVTYYGKHYSTFFFHSKLQTWIYFDDARVKEIGSDWSLMIKKCRLCHYQPLLLLYANPHGTPVNAETAPKEKICVDGNNRQKTMDSERGVADGTSDGEKSPATSKKSKFRLKPKDERRSLFKSKKSLSSGDLTQPGIQLSRTPSNASDTVASSSGKDKQRPSFRRIGNAIMSAVNPSLAMSHLKREMTKKSKRRSSTGSGSESSGEPDLIDLGSSNEDAKLEIMRLYEQSKALNAAQIRVVNNTDSGISSAPSSAGGSVSSTDTNHGGSDEDLIGFNSTWRHSSYDNWPSGHHNTRVAALLQEAETSLAKSENSERYFDFATALNYCTQAEVCFRRVTEENGADVRTTNYACAKKNECQKRARTLQQHMQLPSNFENRTASISQSKQREEELFRQQRQRDQMSLRQQQYQAAPPPYSSVQPRDRSPHFGVQRIVDVPVSTSNHGTQSKNYWEEQYGVSTLPLKVKHKPTVYSSGHYVTKTQQDKSGPMRGVSGICTQQIKPDSMCYSPVHYDRESEITARIKNLSPYSTAPNPKEDNNTVISVGDNRPKMSENHQSRLPAATRRVPNSIFISPSNSSNSSYQAKSIPQSRPVHSASYDPTVYKSRVSQNQPQVTAFQPKPKVYYAGNMALSSRDRSPSPARSVDCLDFVSSSHGSLKQGPPNYVPAPPYSSFLQREHFKSHSASSLPEDPFASNTRGVRQVSARIISDRPVCEKCKCVAIDRRQRFCAGCEQEVYRTHLTTSDLC